MLGPVYIGDNARIGAGSVVLKNLPANCTAVGVPAEVVRINNKAINLPTTSTSRTCRTSWPSVWWIWTAASASWKRPRRAIFPHGPAGGRTAAQAVSCPRP